MPADPRAMTLELYVTAQRRLRVERLPQSGLGASARDEARIERAFAAGSGSGLLHLATAQSRTALPPSLAFARAFAQRYFTELCHLSDAEIEEIEARPSSGHIAPPSGDELSRIALDAPPLKGLEYLDAAALRAVWLDLDGRVRADLGARGHGVRAYLNERNPEWRLVGRVALHLAENKRDDEHPFAFLATYVGGLTQRGDARHLPLAQALKDYAGAANRKRLLALLTPLHAAAERLPWVKALVDSGDIYHALAWTPAEAHQLLRSVPMLEASGLAVRIPDWWKPDRPARPQVSVRIGEQRSAALGADALLDFSVSVSLGGDVLTEAEKRELLAASGGLVRLRGQWVEADGARLAAALAHWKQVEQSVRTGGLTFYEGMRFLAGVTGSEGSSDDAAEMLREWSGIGAGKALRETLSRLRDPGREPDISAAGLRGALRPYQFIGVKWLALLTGLGLGACLADDMGLGKTIQVLALLLHLRAQRGRERANTPLTSLVVAPASLLANWKSEAARFAPELRVLVAHPSESDLDLGEARELDRALASTDLALTTYGMVARSEALRRRRWRLVVLDEAQAIKNAGSRQARAVKELEGTGRVALTGTPVENRLSDLWSLFDFLNPGLLGDARGFARTAKRLAAPEGGGYAPLRRLVQPYLLRRLKTDPRISEDLPEKSEVRAYCTLTREQAALYEQCVTELATKLGGADGIRRRGLVLASLMQLKQICNHPAHWHGRGDYTLARSGKLQRLAALCEEMAARQERVLVFTQFREIVEPLAHRLAETFGRPGLVLHGGTTVAKRRAVVEAFQSEEGPPFLVLSLKAGGTGLNLTAASQVIHFDRWWNPAVENQATDRAFRIGQKRNVLVHKFVCRGTVEERIDALIEAKSDLARELVGEGGEQLVTEMDDEELLHLVSLDMHKACDA